jgi:esterase/lipase superfamily enzyme
MADDFMICVRDVRSGKFIAEPGETRFLRVPPGQNPSPAQAATRKEDKRKWIDDVLAAAKGSQTSVNEGDLLVFIHGYNNTLETVMSRHRQLFANLQALGYQGMLVSFDWPSGDSALNYLEDRSDAKLTALKLVSDCILPLSQYQQRDCRINVHLLAHSAGSYVIREAFDDADDRRQIAAANWTVSQIALIAADISSGSLAEGHPVTSSMFRHCIRLTNYRNPYDAVLKISDIKRVGVAPRAGRIGLPPNAPAKAVDIDCGAYYDTIKDTQPPALLDIYAHTWYFGDPVFTRDLLLTLQGDIDRNRFPTRIGSNNRLILQKPD